MHLFDTLEIEEYNKQKDALLSLAKNICKNLGVYYENLEPVVENYISSWKNLGYDDNTLLSLSNYCFKNSIRTLEFMDRQILKFYKLGIVNQESLNQYFEQVLTQENEMKQILQKLGLSRNVNNFDRECYKNWKSNWNMPDELIDEAVNLAIGKIQPFVYINKTLGLWHEKNVTNVEETKNYKIQESKTLNKNIETRNYTKEEINSLFTNLEEVEI